MNSQPAKKGRDVVGGCPTPDPGRPSASLPTRAPIFLIPLICLAFAAFPAHAHHSSAGRYDSGDILEVEGEIAEVQWRNPHARVDLLVEDKTGAVVEWEVEGASVSALERSGLTADLLRVGDRVRVAGWPPVTERRELFMQNILLPSGEELVTWPKTSARWSDEVKGDFAYWSQTEGDRSQPELGIFRVWSSSFALPGLFSLRRLDVSEFPFTDDGRARAEAFLAAGVNTATQACTPKGMPLIMEQPYPMEFVQDGENIALHIEEYDVVRVIRMGEDAMAAGEVEPRSPFGYSTGHWEGDTLVVTTTRLNWPWLTQSGAPLSEEVVLEERFTPMEDGGLLDYQLTVTDTAMYTEPVVRGKQWIYLPEQKVRPYECTVADAD